MTEKEVADLLAKELRKSLQRHFVGQVNTSSARAQIISYVQGLLNAWCEIENIQTASLPLIEVEVEENKVNIVFFDPDTKKQIGLVEWFSRHTLGNEYGRN